jgi:hypothetical protein
MEGARTHCYVGSLRCGCGVAICVDDPQYAKDTADDVGGMIARGLTVQRLPHEDAQRAFSAECSGYPHEEWQFRIVEARQRRQKSTPSPTADAKASQ